MMIAGWVFLVFFALFLCWMMYIYNGLITLKNEVKNAYAQIDVQLKRRHDLIPNLVSVVKGYMEYERDTLQRVTSARSNAISAVGIPSKAVAENALTQALKSLFAVVENYPDLKSNENVLHLQEELTSTENRIAFSRQLYNDLVANLATTIEVFPNNLVASLFTFCKAEYFSAEEADRRVPAADGGTRSQ